MYSVMIVDDERPARELLKSSFPWEAHGYKIVVEASNGAQAYDAYKLHRPDLIITDIIMPVLNGIELIHKIKLENPQQQFVLLSCHESFDYARQAMRLGVQDYLIKDSLQESELRMVLSSVMQRTGFSMSSPFSARPATYAAERTDALSAIVHGKPVPSNALESLFTGKKAAAFLAVIEISDYKYQIPYHDTKLCEQMHLSSGTASYVIPCHDNGERFALLVVFESTHSLLESMNMRHSILQEIRSTIELHVKSTITFGISTTFYETPSVFSKYQEAVRALDFSVFLGKGKFLYYEALKNNHNGQEIERINQRFSQMKAAFQEGDYPYFTKQLDLAFGKELPGMMQYNYLQHICALLLSFLTMACSDHGIAYERVLGQTAISSFKIGSMESVEEIHRWFKEKFLLVIEIITGEASYSPRIQKIIDYMKQHYTQDISMESISEAFNLHKVYVSRIFKEETGKSPTTYLNELRIHKALELLRNKENSISDVIYQCGFNNPQNFYYIFKQMTGMTPKYYRRSHKQPSA
ncbi:MAG: helix-turn-helix domain-containing protein [Lachnospiraceae bacterium]